MAITLTAKVAQVVKATNKRGTAVFNDKLVDGARSLKVWGWTAADYIAAKQMLELAGCTVSIVEVAAPFYRKNKQSQIRLHVVEPN